MHQLQKNTNPRGLIASRDVFWFLLPISAIVIVDEFVKSFALNNWPLDEEIKAAKFLTLAVHHNWGIAFDIPFRIAIVITISAVIGIFILQTAVRNLSTRPDISFAAFTIILGALGNLYDRIIYGFTVDYLIFFGRSATNLSDLVIILGVVTLFIFSRNSSKLDKIVETS